jgi:hypothetical protein
MPQRSRSERRGDEVAEGTVRAVEVVVVVVVVMVVVVMEVEEDIVCCRSNKQTLVFILFYLNRGTGAITSAFLT